MADQPDPNIDEMTGYLAQAEKSAQYQGVLEEAIASLTEGDAAAFKELMSPNMINTAGEAAVEAVISGQFAPFFSGALNFGSDTTVTDTTDNWGNEGLAFYKTVLFSDGDERPFVIYIVEENGKPVVANLLPNTTYADMHSGQEPGESV